MPNRKISIARRLLLTLTAFSILLLAAVGVSVLAWLTRDAGRWRDPISQWAQDRLGRAMTIAQIEPGISFVHGLTLTLHDVRLTNAAGFGLPNYPSAMLTIARLELGIDLRALVSNRLVLQSLTVDNAVLSLAQDGRGHNNWTFTTADNDRVNEEIASPLQDGIRKINIRDSAISLALLDTSTAVQIESVTAERALDNLAGLKTLTADFIHATKPYHLELSLSAAVAHAPQLLALQLQQGDQALKLQTDYDAQQADHYQLNNLQAWFAGQTIVGAAAIDTVGLRPHVHARLAMPILQFAQSVTMAPAATVQPNANASVFSQALLPWRWLTLLDADVVVDSQQVRYGNQNLGPVHLDLALQIGQLATTLLAQPPGTAQPLRIDLQATAQQQARLRINLPTLDPLLWTAAIGLQPWVSSPISLAADLAAEGATPHDLAAHLQGLIQLQAQPGRLNVASLPPPLRHGLEAVLGPQMLQQAALGCFKATLPIKHGIVALNDAQGAAIGLDSTVLSAVGSGRVDLGTETIAARLLVIPKLVGLTQLVLPVEIGGRLQDPGLSLDLPATAGQIAGQVIGKLADVLPTVRIGVAAAKVMGQDPAQLVMSLPPNPCAPAARIPALPAAAMPDTAASASLTEGRALLDQLIKSLSPPEQPAVVGAP